MDSDQLNKEKKLNKVYSPIQIGVGTYLGGPFAAIYFLKGNFDTLGKKELSKKTLQIGLAVSLLIIAITPFVPEGTPNILIPMLYLIPVIMVVKNHQMTKEEIINSDDYEFQSSWKVFGMSIVWLLLFFAITILFILVLESAGVVSLV